MRALFVAQDTNRIGAPLFLLNLLRWLDRSNPEISLDVLIRQSGPLDADFAAVIAATHHSQPDMRVVTFLASRRLVGKRKKALSSGLRRLAGHPRRMLSRLARNGYDLAFVSNFANAELIPAVAEHIAVTMICRAPELAPYVGRPRHGDGPRRRCGLRGHLRHLPSTALSRETVMTAMTVVAL